MVLSGCAAPLFLTGLGVGSVTVNETTGKTLSDHTISSVSGQDCRISRALQNQTICQDLPISKNTVTTTGVAPTATAEIQSRYLQ